SVMQYVLLLCLLTFHCATSFKFLAYSPLLAKSHNNFMTKITDVLVDAGHEFVMLSEVYDRHLSDSNTKKAQIIEIPQTERAKVFETWINNDVAEEFWSDKSLYEQCSSWGSVMDIYADMCIATLTTPGLLHALRAEQFDAAYVESLHGCAPSEPSSIYYLLLSIESSACARACPYCLILIGVGK
ncbi:hypothetical protein PMAYCL1PPCAC_32067, partial [Pristionchus mayeri]